MDIKQTHITRESEVVWSDLYGKLLAAKLYNGYQHPKVAAGSVNRIGYLYGINNNKPFWAYHVLVELNDQYIAIGTVHALRSGLHLMSIYVQPEYRRRGIGSRLIQALREVYPEACGVGTNQSTHLYSMHGVHLANNDSYLPGMLTKTERHAINERFRQEFFSHFA